MFYHGGESTNHYSIASTSQASSHGLAKSDSDSTLPFVITVKVVAPQAGIDLSTTHPKWRLDGPALSGHLLYSLVNHAYANLYHYHLVQ